MAPTVFLVIEVDPGGDQHAVCICSTLEKAREEVAQRASLYLLEIVSAEIDSGTLKWVDYSFDYR